MAKISTPFPPTNSRPWVLVAKSPPRAPQPAQVLRETEDGEVRITEDDAERVVAEG